jgi:hypothetical protein
MKEKLSILLGAGAAVLVIILVFIYFFATDSIDYSDILLIIIPIMLVIGAIYLLKDRIQNLRAGLPSADERSRKLHWKAGAYSYYAAIYIAIGTMWYNIIFAENLGFPELNTGQVVATIVLLSSIIWFGLQFYFLRKGDSE